MPSTPEPDDAPRPEHPNPMRYRPNWRSLNGEWEFARDRTRIGLTHRWFEGRSLDERIIVPFAYQCELSGIHDHSMDEVVWYARNFYIPENWLGEDRDVLLRFGAVDYRSTVWVNGTEVGHNEGGHIPFAFDIAPFLKPGENRLYVRVEDPLDPYQPRGKQSVYGTSRNIDYYDTTGIWQSVWLEPVPSLRIEDVLLNPRIGKDPAEDALVASVIVHAPGYGLTARIEVRCDGELVAQKETDVMHGRGELYIPIPNSERWTPDSPTLYDVAVTLLRDDVELDRIESYTGFRRIDLAKGKIWLNGEPMFLRLALDQGYWPTGGLTAPTDDALRADVEWCKRFGFNGARKHQKVEDPRWLYWCDRLGFLVWSEMPSAIAWSPVAEERLTAEWQRAVRRDINHPCIVAWVPLNESWGVPSLGENHPGQYSFVERLVALTRRLDGTRPVIDNDGWEHTDVADIFAIHDYTKTGKELRARYSSVTNGSGMQTIGWGSKPKSYLAKGARYRNQPVVLSEIGGFLSVPEDVDPQTLDPLYAAYGNVSGSDELFTKISDLMEAIGDLPFVAGFCYTQLTDVEQEKNGVLTYDRQPKFEPERMKVLLEEIAAKHG